MRITDLEAQIINLLPQRIDDSIYLYLYWSFEEFRLPVKTVRRIRTSIVEAFCSEFKPEAIAEWLGRLIEVGNASVASGFLFRHARTIPRLKRRCCHPRILESLCSAPWSQRGTGPAKLSSALGGYSYSSKIAAWLGIVSHASEGSVLDTIFADCRDKLVGALPTRRHGLELLGSTIPENGQGGSGSYSRPSVASSVMKKWTPFVTLLKQASRTNDSSDGLH